MYESATRSGGNSGAILNGITNKVISRSQVQAGFSTIIANSLQFQQLSALDFAENTDILSVIQLQSCVSLSEITLLILGLLLNGIFNQSV